MALPKCSEYWKSQRKKLRQLLSWVSSEGSVGPMLCQALSQPLTQHVQKYVVLLLSLRDTLDKVGTRAVQGWTCGGGAGGEEKQGSGDQVKQWGGTPRGHSLAPGRGLGA